MRTSNHGSYSVKGDYWGFLVPLGLVVFGALVCLADHCISGEPLFSALHYVIVCGLFILGCRLLAKKD
jgi:hypothetical protein